jgi:tetratricopeptide (TPR) repeat protein
MTETSDQKPAPSQQGRLVPGWLALVVLLLLVAVVGVGGFVVRGLITNPREMTPAWADVIAGEVKVRADPKNTAALYNRGLIQIQTGKGKSGEDSLSAVLNIDPKHALAAKALGEYYASKRQYESVLLAVGSVAAANPDLADLQYLLGEAYENLGQKDKAVTAYNNAIQFAPDLRPARDALGRLQGGR